MPVSNPPEPGLTSVIVVNYNAAHLLAACARAVLANPVNLELLVVDNASKDHSLAALRQHHGDDPRLCIQENQENLGFAGAANQMLARARGDYLLFLNPDCLLPPTALAEFRQVMDAHPEAGLAGPLVRNPDGSEQASSRRGIPDPRRALVRVLHLSKLFPGHPTCRDFVLGGQPLPDEPVALEGISGACMFARRQALEVVGPMDEAYFLHCEDLDWFMRFHAQNWQILFIPSIEVVHQQSFCSRREPLKVLWYKHRGMVRFYRKFFRKRYPRPLSWAVTLAVWTRFALLALPTLIFKK